MPLLYVMNTSISLPPYICNLKKKDINWYSYYISILESVEYFIYECLSMV